MKRKALLIAPLVAILAVAGCATTGMSVQQRRSVEAKEMEGIFDDAFKATLSVLQDSGYIIKHTDYKAGVIQAETGSKIGFWGDVNHEVTVTMEEFGENRVKERITFIKKVDMGDFGKTSKIVEDPEMMKRLYADIQKQMFIRAELKK